MSKIETRDVHDQVNGYLVPIWNSLESRYQPAQVYATVILPGKSKGPHLHMKRSGRFTCVAGSCEIIRRTQDGRYERFFLSPIYIYAISILPGEAAQIICKGEEPCVLINLPTPAWSKEDPDDHPVDNWNPNV